MELREENQHSEEEFVWNKMRERLQEGTEDVGPKVGYREQQSLIGHLKSFSRIIYYVNFQRVGFGSNYRQPTSSLILYILCTVNGNGWGLGLEGPVLKTCLCAGVWDSRNPNHNALRKGLRPLMIATTCPRVSSLRPKSAKINTKSGERLEYAPVRV